MSTASVGGFLLSVFLAAFWNGIVGFLTVIVWGSIVIYLTGWQHLFDGWQIAKEMPLPPVGTVGATLFLIPFQVLGVAMLWAILMALGGRAEMQVRGDTVCFERGIGPFVLRTRFEKSDVRSVALLTTRNGSRAPRHASSVAVWIKRPRDRRAKRLMPGAPSGRLPWLAAVWTRLLVDD